MSIDCTTVPALPSPSRLSFGEAHRQRLQRQDPVLRGQSVTLATKELTQANIPAEKTTIPLESPWESSDDADLVEVCEDALEQYMSAEVGHLDQFVRHEHLVVPPSVLRVWGISFDIFLQRPGDIVRTDYLSYHWAWNTGSNVIESISYCEEDWSPSPVYRYCWNSVGKCGLSSITAAAMTISEYHPLKFSDEWDEETQEDKQDEDSSAKTGPYPNIPCNDCTPEETHIDVPMSLDSDDDMDKGISGSGTPRPASPFENESLVDAKGLEYPDAHFRDPEYYISTEY
ncbi:hypothetical protein PV11_00021 [Exophiala sideris]|uniref:JmjC domain-containing protein n=1 Tax=Exophiala sideris TaxID=1016849 RepID=A0A0D1W6C5_9EURO|nr:hypothetical protein PV11_00021 [Exophiala sideris]